MHKFKIGDKIRVTCTMAGDESQGINVGDICSVTDVFDIDVYVRSSTGCRVGLAGCQFEFYSGGSNEPQAVKYVVGWMDDEDPYQTFVDEKSMRQHLQELADDEDVDKNSVEVFEVSKHYKVTFQITPKLVDQGVKETTKAVKGSKRAKKA